MFFFFPITSHSDRVYIVDTNLRKAVKSVSNHPSEESLEVVYSLISSFGERYSELRVLLSWCANAFGVGNQWPLGIREFIKAISMNSPVCAIFHNNNELISLCERLTDRYPVKRHPTELQTLHNNCPLLFNFLSSTNEDSLPKDTIPIVKRLLNIATRTFQDHVFVDDDISIRDDAHSTLSFFPHHPVIRGRGKYTLDHENKDKSQSKVCTKRHGRHPTLLPGIFLVQCRHGNLIRISYNI